MSTSDNKIQIRHVKGYPSLANFIASDHDKSTAIFRRFDRLSARNLLYLQSELVQLEARQARYDAEDLERATEEKTSARDWDVFQAKAEEHGNVKEKERMALVLEIRAKIKEYSGLLCPRTFSSAFLIQTALRRGHIIGK